MKKDEKVLENKVKKKRFNKQTKKDIRGLKKEYKFFKFNTIFGNTYYIIFKIVFWYIMIFLFINVCINFVSGFFTNFSNPDKYLTSINFLSLIKFNKNGKWLYIFYTIISIFIGVQTFKVHKLSFGDLDKGQKGSTRRTTDEEIRQQFLGIPLEPYDENGNLNEYEGSAGFPVRVMDGKIYICQEMVNVILIGATRSGKGQTYLFPLIDTISRVKESVYSNEVNMLDREYKKPSMIIPDPKLENYSCTYEELKKRGYKTLLLNLIHSDYSIQFNPLDTLTKLYMTEDYSMVEIEAVNIATNILKTEEAKKTNDTYWVDQAVNYFSALLYAHTEDCVKAKEYQKNNIPSVVFTHKELLSKGLLDDYFMKRDKYNPARRKYMPFKSDVMPKETLQSIFSTLNRGTAIFENSSISNLTRTTSIDILDLGFSDNPVALYIAFSEVNKASHVLITLLIEQIYSQSAYFADAHTKEGKLPRPIWNLFDEIGNTPKLPSLSNNISLALGRNIMYLLVIQSFSQLDSVYGKDEAKNIRDNSSVFIYLLANDVDTTKYMSELIGNETSVNVTRQGSPTSHVKTSTETPETKPILYPDELRRLAEGSNVICRTVPRKDLQGNDIKQYPIINDKYKSIYAYKYLGDIFPKRGFLQVRDSIEKDNKLEYEDIVFYSLEYFNAKNFLFDNLRENEVLKKKFHIKKFDFPSEMLSTLSFFSGISIKEISFYLHQFVQELAQYKEEQEREIESLMKNSFIDEDPTELLENRMAEKNNELLVRFDRYFTGLYKNQEKRHIDKISELLQVSKKEVISNIKSFNLKKFVSDYLKKRDVDEFLNSNDKKQLDEAVLYIEKKVG